MLTISQLASYAGVTVRAVRHYHAKGLLPEPVRDHSGYRRYDAAAVVESIQSGLLFGTAAEVDGMVERMQKELGGHATVIATGGLAETLAPYCQLIDRQEPWLTLKGLRLIYEKNSTDE